MTLAAEYFRAFQELCRTIASGVERSGKAARDKLLQRITAEAEANALALIAEATKKGILNEPQWIRAALRSQSPKILLALPPQSPDSVAFGRKELELIIQVLSAEMIEAAISRGASLGPYCGPLLKRATSGKDRGIAAILEKQTEWHGGLLFDIFLLSKTQRAAYADYLGPLLQEVVKNRPEQAEKELLSTLVSNQGGKVILLLSAGARLTKPSEQQLLDRRLNNHTRIKLMRHGSDLAALMRDRDLLDAANAAIR